MQSSNPSIWEVEAGGLGFKDSLRYHRNVGPALVIWDLIKKIIQSPQQPANRWDLQAGYTTTPIPTEPSSPWSTTHCNISILYISATYSNGKNRWVTGPHLNHPNLQASSPRVGTSCASSLPSANNWVLPPTLVDHCSGAVPSSQSTGERPAGRLPHHPWHCNLRCCPNSLTPSSPWPTNPLNISSPYRGTTYFSWKNRRVNSSVRIHVTA